MKFHIILETMKLNSGALSCFFVLSLLPFSSSLQNSHLPANKETGSISVSYIEPCSSGNRFVPVFPTCSEYSPVWVKEEQAQNTFVAHVNAVDLDGESIKYFLEGDLYGRMPFYINDRTGVIKTSRIIDRDPPNNEKEFNITVGAQDISKNSKLGFCQITVVVTDINDNSPMFYNWDLENITIPKNSSVGHILVKILASDNDIGRNSIINFSLYSKSMGDSQYFTIDKWNGYITLSKAIDKYSKYIFQLTIKVEDMGEPKRYSCKDLKIRVV